MVFSHSGLLSHICSFFPPPLPLKIPGGLADIQEGLYEDVYNFVARIDAAISSLRTVLAIKSAQAKRLAKMIIMCTHFTYTKDELDIAGVLASPSLAFHDFIRKHGLMPQLGSPQHKHWRASLLKFSKQVIIHNIWLHKNRTHTAKET